MRKLLLIILGVVLITSCKEDREGEDEEVNTQISQETTASDAFYNHIYTIANEEVKSAEDEEFTNKTNQTSQIDPCADVTYYLSGTANYIENLTIEYKDGSCWYNGRNRLGKIHVHLTGRLNEIGTVMTVTLEDFYVSNHKVEGTQVSTNKGLTTNLNWLIEQTVTDGKVTLPSGDFLTWESEKDITLDLINQNLTYTGSGSGSSSTGFNYSLTITTPLYLDLGCSFVQKGKIEIDPNGFATQTIDYGNGTCDNKAVISSNGKTIEFTLN